MEAQYSICLGSKPHLAPTDELTSTELQTSPLNWTRECDEQLVNFLCEVVELENDNMGVVKDYVDAIEVSTSCVSMLSGLFIDTSSWLQLSLGG